MKKYIVCLITLVLSVLADLQAQTKQYYNLGWEIGIPVGNFSDYISSASLRGGYFSGNVFVTDVVSVGFKFGYNSYHENMPRQTWYMPYGTAVTASSYNYSTQAPIQVGGYYHFKTNGQLEPYAGLGLGVNYITEETLVQDLETYNDQWAFLMTPEIGLRYQLKNVPIGITLKAAYNLNFNSYVFWGTEYDNIRTFNLGLSVGWTIR